MTYILALDQGTSSSRAMIYDAAGTVIASAQRRALIAPSRMTVGWSKIRR